MSQRELRFVGSESRVVLQDRVVLDVVGAVAYPRTIDTTVNNDNNDTTTTATNQRAAGMSVTVLA